MKESPLDVCELPHEWPELIDLRPRYRVCRVAFFLAGLGLGLHGLSSLCYVLTMFWRIPGMRDFMRSPWWTWLVGAPITFGTLIGSLLLIGRWPGTSWKTRTILLTLMNSVDLVSFVTDHAEAFGLPVALVGRGDDGLAFAIGHAMGLIELLLFASLSAEVAEHLGLMEADAVARVARLAATISMTLWIMVTLQQLDWMGGFPPRFMRWRLETFLMFLGSLAAQAVSSLLVTILCGHACVLCSRMLTDLERERKEGDPFRSRSELS